MRLRSLTWLSLWLCFCSVLSANASAWNPAKGSGEIITGYIVSDAQIAVSPIGTHVPLELYRKEIAQSYGNFGLTDRWAVVGSFDWQTAQIIGPDLAVGFSKPSSMSAGLQYQLLRAPGRAVALSLSYYEGIDIPPTLLTLENRTDTVEFRALWGESRIIGATNFFFDAQVAGRMSLDATLENSRADFTLGMEPHERIMLLAKGRYINIEPGSFRGFAIDRQIRVESEVSAVLRLWNGNHIELGYGGVVHARNAVLERGWKLGFWSQF